MKRYFVAAGALLLGTSAVAWAAGADAGGKSGDESSVVTADKGTVDKSVAGKSWDKGAIAAKLMDTKLATSAEADESKLALASAEKEAGGKPQTAELDWDDPAAQAKLAHLNAGMSSDPAVQTKLAMADSGTGMGGPLDESAAVKTTDLTPRPATMNYPPCDPGPGDDRCIQLYEPGVRAQLASWDRDTGGLADDSATNAMGGPYEPVDIADAGATAASLNADIHEAMNGDGSVDVASGETADTELAHHGTADGMGGPIESVSGYPPCDPGPGDDRCIQLYEPGVTGAGN
jgi:hypothetical protein